MSSDVVAAPPLKSLFLSAQGAPPVRAGQKPRVAGMSRRQGAAQRYRASAAAAAATLPRNAMSVPPFAPSHTIPLQEFTGAMGAHTARGMSAAVGDMATAGSYRRTQDPNATIAGVCAASTVELLIPGSTLKPSTAYGRVQLKQKSQLATARANADYTAELWRDASFAGWTAGAPTRRHDPACRLADEHPRLTIFLSSHADKRSTIQPPGGLPASMPHSRTPRGPAATVPDDWWHAYFPAAPTFRFVNLSATRGIIARGGIINASNIQLCFVLSSSGFAQHSAQGALVQKGLHQASDAEVEYTVRDGRKMRFRRAPFDVPFPPQDCTPDRAPATPDGGDCACFTLHFQSTLPSLFSVVDDPAFGSGDCCPSSVGMERALQVQYAALSTSTAFHSGGASGSSGGDVRLVRFALESSLYSLAHAREYFAAAQWSMHYVSRSHTTGAAFSQHRPQLSTPDDSALFLFLGSWLDVAMLVSVSAALHHSPSQPPPPPRAWLSQRKKLYSMQLTADLALEALRHATNALQPLPPTMRESVAAALGSAAPVAPTNAPAASVPNGVSHGAADAAAAADHLSSSAIVAASAGAMLVRDENGDDGDDDADERWQAAEKDSHAPHANAQRPATAVACTVHTHVAPDSDSARPATAAARTNAPLLQPNGTPEVSTRYFGHADSDNMAYRSAEAVALAVADEDAHSFSARVQHARRDFRRHAMHAPRRSLRVVSARGDATVVSADASSLHSARVVDALGVTALPSFVSEQLLSQSYFAPTMTARADDTAHGTYTAQLIDDADEATHCEPTALPVFVSVGVRAPKRRTISPPRAGGHSAPVRSGRRSGSKTAAMLVGSTAVGSEGRARTPSPVLSFFNEHDLTRELVRVQRRRSGGKGSMAAAAALAAAALRRGSGGVDSRRSTGGTKRQSQDSVGAAAAIGDVRRTNGDVQPGATAQRSVTTSNGGTVTAEHRSPDVTVAFNSTAPFDVRRTEEDDEHATPDDSAQQFTAHFTCNSARSYSAFIPRSHDAGDASNEVSTVNEKHRPVSAMPASDTCGASLPSGGSAYDALAHSTLTPAETAAPQSASMVARTARQRSSLRAADAGPPAEAMMDLSSSQVTSLLSAAAAPPLSVAEVISRRSGGGLGGGTEELPSHRSSLDVAHPHPLASNRPMSAGDVAHAGVDLLTMICARPSCSVKLYAADVAGDANSAAPLRCATCLSVLYCSQACMGEHWLAAHRDECVRLQAALQSEAMRVASVPRVHGVAQQGWVVVSAVSGAPAATADAASAAPAHNRSCTLRVSVNDDGSPQLYGAMLHGAVAMSPSSRTELAQLSAASGDDNASTGGDQSLLTAMMRISHFPAHPALSIHTRARSRPSSGLPRGSVEGMSLEHQRGYTLMHESLAGGSSTQRVARANSAHHTHPQPPKSPYSMAHTLQHVHATMASKHQHLELAVSVDAQSAHRSRRDVGHVDASLSRPPVRTGGGGSVSAATLLSPAGVMHIPLANATQLFARTRHTRAQRPASARTPTQSNGHAVPSSLQATRVSPSAHARHVAAPCVFGGGLLDLFMRLTQSSAPVAAVTLSAAASSPPSPPAHNAHAVIPQVDLRRAIAAARPHSARLASNAREVTHA